MSIITNVINDKCSNATSPINIEMKNIQGPCILKCDYNYEYGTYSPNITNKETYLSLNYSGKINPVKYNNERYTVKEVRIYQPSLHQFNGKHTQGEIMIIHGGPGKNLIVCIPFLSGGKNDKGSSQLSSLLEEASLRTPNINESVTNSSGNFSLDNFIPNRKGYFAYTGTLPYEPCNGKYSFIVYKQEDGLHVNSRILNKLQKIIKKTVSKVKSNSLFFNKNGANSKNNNDDIYIDCQPVNDSGELIIDQKTDTSSNDETVEMDLQPYIQIFGAVAVGLLMIYSAKFIFLRKKNN